MPIGRSKDLAWAITATLVDNTDLWEEEVNDDHTKYLVDGEWRDLSKIYEKIKVKGGETIDFTVNYTHRGPMMDFDVISSATPLLFAGATPKIERGLKYSFGWAQSLPVPDQSMKLMKAQREAASVKEVIEAFDE